MHFYFSEHSRTAATSRGGGEAGGGKSERAGGGQGVWRGDVVDGLIVNKQTFWSRLTPILSPCCYC